MCCRIVHLQPLYALIRRGQWWDGQEKHQRAFEAKEQVNRYRRLVSMIQPYLANWMHM